MASKTMLPVLQRAAAASLARQTACVSRPAWTSGHRAADASPSRWPSQAAAFSTSRIARATADDQNDPGNLLRRLASSPTAMQAIAKLMTVIKEEGGPYLAAGVKADGSLDPGAMPKRPSMFEMAKMMMNSKIRDAVKEVHAELQKAGIELTPERVSAILQADELIRGLKK